jgi:hypothetical protein
MVDESTGRLLYLYDPENDVAIGDCEPIRDLAAIWDVEVLSAFLGRDDLRRMIRRSLGHFGRLIVERDGHAIVAPRGDLCDRPQRFPGSRSVWLGASRQGAAARTAH